LIIDYKELKIVDIKEGFDFASIANYTTKIINSYFNFGSEVLN